MPFMHQKDSAMDHERALRALSIQHRLHIGAAAPRPGLSGGSEPRPQAPRRAGARTAPALRTLWRRRRSTARRRLEPER